MKERNFRTFPYVTLFNNQIPYSDLSFLGIEPSKLLLSLLSLVVCDLVLNDFLLVVVTFSVSSLQVRMTVQLETSGISTVNQVTGCWFAQTGCPAAIAPVGEREIWQLQPTSPSCEEKALLPAGGRTASRGAVETGEQGAGWERDELPTALLFLLLSSSSSQLCNRLTLQN